MDLDTTRRTVHLRIVTKARGRQTPRRSNTTGGKVTAALWGTRDATNTTGKAQERVEQLQQELQKAELEASLVTAMAMTTTNILSSNPDPVASCEGIEPSVGPTLTAEVRVKGRSATALIDEGSPVSLISIDFLLQALLPIVGEEKTSSQKVEALRARMQPPSMVVRNFGGLQVNVICQTTVTLSHRKHKHQVTILVQKGTPLELLLGTDTLGKLGFQILETRADGQVTDLLPVEERQNSKSYYLKVAIYFRQGCTVIIINSTRSEWSHTQSTEGSLNPQSPLSNGSSTH